MSEQAATERAFSANFHVWHPAGVRVQVTVRDGDVQSLDWYLAAAMAAIEKSLALGFSVTEPLPVEGEKLERIAGYVVGGYKDKEKGKFFPCVHLYPDDNREFKCVTVYPEQFHLLPFLPGGTQFDGPAPKAEDARLKGVFRKCSFVAILQPRFQNDGQPVLSEKGNIIYKFAGVQGAQSQATAANALDENKAVEWAVKQNRFTTADDALAALREQRTKFPRDDVDAFKLHWRDYVISLPLLQTQPPAEEPDATPADDDPFDKPPFWRTPKDAQAWAVQGGHCANEHEAANSWANEVKRAGGFNKANASAVFEAFYRKHMSRQMQPA